MDTTGCKIKFETFEKSDKTEWARVYFTIPEKGMDELYRTAIPTPMIDTIAEIFQLIDFNVEITDEKDTPPAPL